VRITKNGGRFLVERAPVWNLVDANATNRGQATMFEHWRWL
jgi:hypothetical protein